jgi:hypothetical protein
LQLTNHDYSYYYEYVCVELSKVFAKYEQKFGNIQSYRQPQINTAGKKRKVWGKIFGSDAVGGGSAPSSCTNASASPIFATATTPCLPLSHLSCHHILIVTLFLILMMTSTF